MDLEIDKKEAKRIYMKKYRELNREKVRELNKKSYYKYKDKISDNKKSYNKKYYLENKDKIDDKNKAYYQSNKQRYYDNTTNLVRKKKSESSLFRIIVNTRCLISRSIKNRGYLKNSKSEEILDCSFVEFLSYIESKFESWMNWDNYGLYNGESNYGWDLDHIIPISSCNSEEDVIKLNHFSNLQPLCSYTNRVIKRNNYQQK